MKLKHFATACAALLVAAAGSASAAAAPLNVRDGSDGAGAALYVVDRASDGTRTVKPLLPRTLRTTAQRPLPLVPAGDPVCGADAVAYEGEPMPPPETGTLSTLAFGRSANINQSGRIAFVAQIDGSTRNQGVFTADANGVAVVAIGCGNGGGSGSTDGCGDATPIGGTFSGLFTDTWATPPINDLGDVVFLSDVAGGSSPRALFLYQASTGTIVRIAAVGDPSPLGGTLTAIGPGAINNAQTIAFLASTDDAQTSDIFVWQDGIVSHYVAAGDAAPGGGTFTFIGTESFGYLDGTTIPSGPAPAINESGQIAFRGIASGPVSAGEILSTDGVHDWQVAAGEDAPGGGTFIDFEAPLLNDNGEIAWFSDLSGSSAAAGWFAGSPGNFRRAFAFSDPIGEGIVWGMAISRNPFRALDNAGDLVVWGSLQLPDLTQYDMIVLSRDDGAQEILALQGQPSPLGGTWNGMDGWPVMNSVSQVRMGAGLVDAPYANAHVVLALCELAAPAYVSEPPPDTALDFGDVEVGTTSAPLGIDVGNHGTGPAPGSDLTIASAVADDPAFVVTIVDAGPFPAGTDPDGSPDIEVRCAPGTAGAIAGTLHVVTNDPGEPPDGFAYPLACNATDDTIFGDGFDGPQRTQVGVVGHVPDPPNDV
jgi:hypothetical protein